MATTSSTCPTWTPHCNGPRAAPARWRPWTPTAPQKPPHATAKIKQAGIPFRLPQQQDLPERLDTVLEAIYATFTQDWSDPADLDPRHHDLSDEGI